MKKVYILMIAVTLLMVFHSLYKKTFDVDDVKFALPMLIFFGYLLFKKRKEGRTNK